MGWQTSAQERITLKGTVKDSLHQPIPFANITIVNGKEGGISDEEGQFSFITTLTLPFEVQISSIGYQTATLQINNAQQAKNLVIYLSQKQENLGQVDVEGQITDQSFNKINPKLVNRLPDAGGGNIEGLVKSQMGVSSNNELSSQYRVRGGNYDENLVYVNDIETIHHFIYLSAYPTGIDGFNYYEPNFEILESQL